MPEEQGWREMSASIEHIRNATKCSSLPCNGFQAIRKSVNGRGIDYGMFWFLPDVERSIILLQIEEHSSDDEKKKTINQYTVHEVLGRGAFGTVRRVTNKMEGHRVDYAMKEMSKKQLQVRGGRVNRFEIVLYAVAAMCWGWGTKKQVLCDGTGGWP